MTAAPAEGLEHFNSIKVRLELLREQIKKVSEQDFNSIKVRLELNLLILLMLILIISIP